tara:strand:+ start:597 stop:1259 length:663 start_codon:yes stop_codon:yes gene_type:complete
MALTKFNFNSFDVTTAASKGLGFNASANAFDTIDSTSLVLIKTLTASSSATLSFVNGSSDVVLDGTYPLYRFVYSQIHAATEGAAFQFNMSTDGGSNYNVAKTSTFFEALHNEGGSAQGLSTESGEDLAQGTGFQNIVKNFGNGNDECASGELYLFNPSSTTFVKNFIAESSGHHQSDYNLHDFCSGYGDTTSAVNAVQFKMSTGNIDSGIIKLYGIKDS